MKISSNVVDLSVSCHPKMGIQEVQRILKSRLAPKIRELHPELKSSMSAMWSGRTFVCTEGMTQEANVEAFVQEEKTRKQTAKKEES
jgi:REP element-mobilizing transposase RayT